MEKDKECLEADCMPIGIGISHLCYNWTCMSVTFKDTAQDTLTISHKKLHLPVHRQKLIKRITD